MTLVQTVHYIMSSMWHCYTNCIHTITSSMWHCCSCTDCTLHHTKHVTVMYKLHTTSHQACDTAVQTAHTSSCQTCDIVVQQAMFFRLRRAKHKFHTSIYTHNEKPGQQDHPPVRIMGRFFILDRLVIPERKRETACLSSVHHNRLPKHVLYN